MGPVPVMARGQRLSRSIGSERGPIGSLFRPEVEALTPYQPGRPVEDVQRELGLERVVKLASNEGPFPPFPAAIEAMRRAQHELNRYPDGGIYRLHEALAARHGVAFEEVCVGLGRRRLHRHAEPGGARPGRRDRLRLAVVPELRHLRRASRGDGGHACRCATTATTSSALAAADRAADEARLRLPPEQPDRDDEHAQPSSTPSSSAVPEHVLVVVDQAYFEYIDHPDYPDAVEAYVRAGRRVSRAADVLEDLRPRRPARRLRGRPVRTSAPRWRRLRRPFDVTTTAQVAALASLGDAAELERRRAAQRRRARRACRDPPPARARPGRGRGRQLRLRRPRRGRAPLFERLLRARRDRPPARRVRGADRDPHLGRHAGGARVPRRGPRARSPRAPDAAKRPRALRPCPTRRLGFGAVTGAPSGVDSGCSGTAASDCSSSRRSAPGSGTGWR